jgi:hypothetical protein
MSFPDLFGNAEAFVAGYTRKRRFYRPIRGLLRIRAVMLIGSNRSFPCVAPSRHSGSGTTLQEPPMPRMNILNAVEQEAFESALSMLWHTAR